MNVKTFPSESLLRPVPLASMAPRCRLSGARVFLLRMLTPFRRPTLTPVRRQDRERTYRLTEQMVGSVLDADWGSNAAPALQALALTPGFVRSLLASGAPARATAPEGPGRPSARRIEQRGAAQGTRRPGRRRAERKGRNRPHAPHNPGGLYADRPDEPRRRPARRRGRLQARLSDAEPRLRPGLHPKLRRGDEGGAERVRRQCAGRFSFEVFGRRRDAGERRASGRARSYGPSAALSSVMQDADFRDLLRVWSGQ